MAYYGSFLEDKKVLSVVDERRPTGSRNHLIDAREAGNIIMCWMACLAKIDVHQKLLLCLSGRNCTPKGATQLATFLAGLKVIANRITVVEMSGICTTTLDDLSVADATAAQEILVQAINQNIPYRALMLENVDDNQIHSLLPLTESESLKILQLSNSRFSVEPDTGLQALEAALTENVANTTHRPSRNLVHLGFYNLRLGEPHEAAQVIGSILEECTSIRSIQVSHCLLGETEMNSIVDQLSGRIILHAQVKESLQCVEFESCDLKEAFGLLLEQLFRCKNLKLVNLKDCNLSAKKNRKISYKLGKEK